MTCARRFFALVILLLIMAISASAQVQTGTPPFGSFGGGPDVINLANLNAHLTIPVLHKPGRGRDFDYDLAYDSSIWTPITVGSTKTWQPVSNWGWSSYSNFGSGLTGYVNYFYSSTYCYDQMGHPNGANVLYNNFVYTDPWGTTHKITGYYQVLSGGCGSGITNAFPGYATDGSGYSLQSKSGPLTAIDGTIIGAPFNPGYGAFASSVTDRNGNEISASSTGLFTDTLGTTALTVVGTAPTQTTFTYKTSTGGTAQFTIHYVTKNIKTNFACSGVNAVTEYAANSVNLVNDVTLPDGSAYTFTYEDTPSNAGYVTGRIKIIKLPSGGTITYAYSGGGTGVNGISCVDGSGATLVRTTADGSWTYAQAKNSGAASTTTINDPTTPTANQSVIQFQGIYETQRLIYQGSAPTNLLQTVNTCYNGAAPPCTSTAVVIPIGQVTITKILAGTGNLQCKHFTSYNVFGQPTEIDDYDYGTGAPAATPLQTTQLTYTSLMSNPVSYLASTLVRDGSGTPQYWQEIKYDEYVSFTGANCITTALQHDNTNYGCAFILRGNPTSFITYATPATHSGGIIKSFTYNSVGNLLTAQLNCCQQKQWVYSATTQYAYPDSVIIGSGTTQLTTSFVYDNNSGVVLSTTDPNAQKSSFSYDTSLRPATVTRSADSAQFTYTYPTPNTTPLIAKVTMPLQIPTTTQQITTLDSLGRPTKVTTADSSGTSYSISEVQYDSLGRAYRQSNPHNSSAQYWTTKHFDALGRVTSTALPAPDQSQTNYAYADSSVTITDPTGKLRKMQFDAIGRLVSVWEPDPANQNSLILQTTYSYNVFNNLTRVTQGSQTRSYAYDAFGRLASMTTPEAGTVCFGTLSGSTCQANGYDSYDNLLYRTDARGVITTYGYDGLNRLASVGYNVGTTGVPATPTVNFTYGTSAAQFNNGRLITMTDGPGSEQYTYNNLGQMTILQKIINSTAYPISYGYNTAGGLMSITYPSGRVVQEYVDAIGRLSSVVGTLNSVNTTYASGFNYNPAFQSTGFQYGNGLFASYGFSSDRLQLNCLDYSTTNRSGTCAHDATTKFGLSYSYGSAGSNNGQISGITDSVDNGRSATYTFDSLYRLSTAATTGSTNYPAWGLSMSYDRYGNRTAQTAVSGCVTPMSCPQPSVTVSPTTNRVTGSPYAYDLSGNMTNDGSNTVVYDGENRAISATNGGSSGAYTYDGNGIRVKKCLPNCTNPTSWTVYVFSGNLVVGEYDNGASVTSPSREYIYSDGVKVATISGSVTTYQHSDHLSVRLLTDSSGNKIGERGHFPYGETLYESGTTTKVKFTTYERDNESGNDYAMARMYINRLARFSTPDSFAGTINDPQSLNRYSFALNDPIDLVDPEGEYCQYYGTNFGDPTDVEETDFHSDPGECAANGGQWFPDTNWTVLVTANTWDQELLPGDFSPSVVEPRNSVGTLFPKAGLLALLLATKPDCAKFLEQVARAGFVSAAGSPPYPSDPAGQYEQQLYDRISALQVGLTAWSATADNQPGVDPTMGNGHTWAEVDRHDQNTIDFYKMFNQAVTKAQAQVLLHEAVHMVGNDASDQQLAAAAGVPDALNMDISTASSSFQDQLKKHCK